LENQAKFHLQKIIWDFKTLMKNYGPNSERIFENVKKNVFSNPSLNFVHNFSLESWNLKQISRDESNLIFQLFLVQSFLKKVILLCQNDIWNSSLNTISTSNLTMNSRIPTNPNWYILHGLFYLLLPNLYKDLVFSSLNAQNKWLLRLCEIIAKYFGFREFDP